VHIARKQYLDGSIPTGFQRTAIVGVNGRLPFRGRTLSVTQVSVEEDSCREVSDRGHLIVWRTDRLGMPLIETVTGPELQTPEEVEEAILLIGRVCRSTGHVRVGMGASRQDVNVSVRGGKRVEIKGVPKASWARRLVHGEAIRQVNLLQLRDELHRRGFTTPESIISLDHDVTDLFTDSPLHFLRRESFAQFARQERRRVGFEMLDGRFCVRAVRLPHMAGTLSWPTQPGLDFAHELAGRVRVIACLDQQPILLHSEKWPDYSGAKQELERLKRRINCEPEDAVVVVWGIEQDTRCAADEMRIRYADAVDGVPHETRQPWPDGSTEFERILPGPDRMYPDTDSPPQRIVRERVDKLAASLPEPPWGREERYRGVGLPQDDTYYLIRRGGARLVDLVVEQQVADLRSACFFFAQKFKALRRAGIDVDVIDDAKWCELFRIMKSSDAIRDDWKRIVGHMAARPDLDLPQILEQYHNGQSPANWEDEVEDVAMNTTMDHADGSLEQHHRFLMGILMSKLRGRVAATRVATALRDALEKDA
jgi:glutamyl-tRNA(Gln) amidotransferase subunit E